MFSDIPIRSGTMELSNFLALLGKLLYQLIVPLSRSRSLMMLLSESTAHSRIMMLSSFLVHFLIMLLS